MYIYMAYIFQHYLNLNLRHYNIIPQYMQCMRARTHTHTHTHIYNTVFLWNFFGFQKSPEYVGVLNYGYWVVDTNYNDSQIKWVKMSFKVKAVYQ
jgi:hypothetical protein